MVSPGQGRIGRRLAAILAARIRRREVIALLGGAAIIWPIAVSAEQATVPLVGLLTPRATGEDPHLLAAFREGLKGAGYVEGQNVAIEYRFAENQYNRLPALVAELVQRQVSVIATFGAAASSAAKTATITIPVIFVSGADPIGLGFVDSLNRPGGNLTGLTQLTARSRPNGLSCCMR
jgi:putative ABC transport system substrate-binding protein